MDKKPRILFCINDLKVGGAEKVFIKDANFLSQNGFLVYFSILFGQKSDQTLLGGLNIPTENIFLCQANSLFDWQGFKRLKRFVREKNISMVYSTLNEANIWSRLLKIFIPKIKVIIREANVADIKPLKFKILDFVLYPFTEKIAAVSIGVKKSLNYLPQKKIIVLENAVDIPERQAELKSEIKSPNLIFVGSLTKKKNISFLIEALKIFKEKGNNFQLKIIGEGDERREIEKLIEEYKLKDKILLLGRLSSEEVKRHYLQSDIFVLPSKYEGSPNVLLEALSFGLPIITSNFLGVEGIIKDKETGLVIPLGNPQKLAEAINFYVNNLEERSRIAQNGFEMVKEKYSTEKHATNLIKILGLKI